MKKFDIGDKVRCIDAINSGDELVLNKIYTTEDFTIGFDGRRQTVFVKLEEVIGTWHNKRFEVLQLEEPKVQEVIFKTGDKVRCINAEDSHELKQGEIYTVEREQFGSDLSLVGVGFCWGKYRFELVEAGEEPTKELKEISVTLNAEQVQYLLKYAVERMIEEQMKRKKSQLDKEV